MALLDFIKMRGRIFNRRNGIVQQVPPPPFVLNDPFETVIIGYLSKDYREELTLQQIKVIAYDVARLARGMQEKPRSTSVSAPVSPIDDYPDHDIEYPDHGDQV